MAFEPWSRDLSFLTLPLGLDCINLDNLTSHYMVKYITKAVTNTATTTTATTTSPPLPPAPPSPPESPPPPSPPLQPQHHHSRYHHSYENSDKQSLWTTLSENWDHLIGQLGPPPVEGWGKVGAWQNVALPLLSNTRTPLQTEEH